MTPTTLKCWIDLLHEAFFRAECTYLDYRENVDRYGIMVRKHPLALEYQQYQRLIEWIEKRIINKYGEQQ